MTTHPQPDPPTRPRALAEGFPAPGRRIEHAYRELDKALHGTEQEKKALGNPRLLARPWDPPTCADPALRAELWQWLDRFVTWLNHEYCWDVSTMIPTCWPHHPHLVHEIAVLADLRRRASHALTGEILEEWHRYALPAFTDRMRQRIKSHCDDKNHQPWPAQARHTRHTADQATADREHAFHGDVTTTAVATEPPPSTGPRLQLVDGLRVDLETGEIN